jgi:hypothetical protein
MAQDGTFHAAEVADRTAGSPPAPTDSNIPHADTANRQQAANNPSIIDALLREPVLAAGENIEDFRALVAEVSDTCNPTRFLTV